MKKKCTVSLVIVLCIVAIFLGKFVRYTVMRDSLVVSGIGWSMIEYINSGNVHFGITISNTETEETIGATDNANAIYSFINVLDLKTYYEFEIFISFIWNIITLIIIAKYKKYFSIFETIFILVSVSVLNIFNFCLAKEPIQMIYFVFMYIVLASKKKAKNKYVMCAAIFFLCYLTYRNYYILMLGFYIFITVLYKFFISKIKKVRLKHIVYVFLAIFICYLIFLNVAKIIDVSSYNELINVRLRTSKAASDMRAIFMSRNIIIFTIDYIIMIFRMMIPIELIKLGPKYLIYALYQMLITYIIVKNFKDIKKINATRRIAICIFVAFLMGSAAFEPDFGSWVRHEAVIFPIFLTILNNKNENSVED